MNYKKIIIDGYDENKNQGTDYVSYFKIQAQINKRDNFVEYIGFFNCCKAIINGYKTEIKNQYLKRLHENDWALNAYYSAKKNGETTDQNGEPIQKHIDYIENDKKFVENRGYINNRYFICTTNDTGDIEENILYVKRKLYYSDVSDLERAVIQAEKELNPIYENQQEVNTEKPQRIINDEALKPYFISSFKGMGNNINYFEWLISHLQQERTPKAFAQIALMIYNSEKLNDTKPNTFKGWYKIFCECVGCEQKTYKPKDLKPYPKTLTTTFNYL